MPTSRPPDSERAVRRVIVVEGICNAVVLAIKVAAGVATGSMAILSDAVHSAVDLANNVVVWFVALHSNRPADAGHPYGHRKFETLAIFGLGTLLTVVGVEVALTAITGGHRDIVAHPFGLALMISVLACNLGLALWQRSRARALGSALLHADASHTLGDVGTTVAVIAGWQLAAHGWLWADRIVAVSIGVLVFVLAFKLLRSVVPGLTDAVAHDAETVANIVHEVPAVTGVGRVRSRWLSDTAVADIIVYVEPDLTVGRAHAVADQVERALADKLGLVDVSVHIEPTPCPAAAAGPQR